MSSSRRLFSIILDHVLDHSPFSLLFVFVPCHLFQLSRAKVAFLLSFSLPENALQNSLTLNIRWNSGENDPVTNRVVAFDNGIETLGEHLFNMTNLSLASNDGTDGGKWRTRTPCIQHRLSTPSRD